ncbi:hypothetical protein [Rhizobium leguminosarum]|uniref:hypothetical protein n=1 Tax=Rhizobium leguminosarum TaxID=384 RepID=UPI0012F68E6F|nr:hypothetical protein [Rhizobium leguminosarum]
MERDGVAHRVPVRFWSEPWDVGGSLPDNIDFSRAQCNAIILLYDDAMAAPEVKGLWEEYVNAIHQKMEERGNVDLYMAFGDPAGAVPLRPDQNRGIQYARREIGRSRSVQKGWRHTYFFIQFSKFVII